MAPLTREDFSADLAEVHRVCAAAPSFVPIVSDGILFACNQRNLPSVKPDLSVEDFVLGMEALQLPFHLARHFDGSVSLYVSMSHWKLQASWADRVRALSSAFPPERYSEVAEYLEGAGFVFDTTANPICQSVICDASAEVADPTGGSDAPS